VNQEKEKRKKMPPKTTKKEEGFTTPPSEANEEYTIHETKGILYLYSPEAATFEIKDTEVAVKIRKEGQWGGNSYCLLDC